MKSNSYLGAHVGWKVVRAFTVEAKRRGKPRRWSGLDIAGCGGDVKKYLPCWERFVVVT
jgi:hypothetical protein